MKKHTLDPLISLPLWELIEAHPRKSEVLLQQGVVGLHELLFGGQSKAHFTLQKRRNLHFHENALKFLNTLASSNSDICLLKGACLLEDIYPYWGERFMSDIDIYCSNMDEMEEAALSFGMKRTNPEESYWLGNSHKREFFLETSLGNIPFEFHSKLFWHKEDPEKINFRDYSGGKGLALEECLIFLIGHYAFQHTCQKLYWLIDIYLFLIKYEKKIDYKRFIELMTYFQFDRSVLVTKALLKSLCSYDWSAIEGETSFPIRVDFACEDSQRHWYYLLLKWYLKNGLRTNIRYNLAWLRS